FFRDAGAAGIDPRKFLWHGEAALITRLAGVEPLVVWRHLPILLSPLLVLNAAAFGMLLSGAAGAAIAAWMILLTYGGSLAGAAMLPFVLWQVLRTPHAVNPIHTAPQGLLTLWDRVRVVSPGVLWDWMGPAWLLIPLLAPRVWRIMREDGGPSREPTGKRGGA